MTASLCLFLNATDSFMYSCLKVASTHSASLKLKAKTLALLTFFALGSAFETNSKRSLMSAKFGVVFGPISISILPSLLGDDAMFLETADQA